MTRIRQDGERYHVRVDGLDVKLKGANLDTHAD